MEKRWILKPNGDEELVVRLSEELKVDRNIANLLAQRGIKNFEEARSFFRPELNQLHDPFLMRDMDKAIARIEKAIEQKEKILVYGDYDVDGTSAVALVYSFFKKIYPAVDFYIPDRYSEGYGISFQGIDYARHNNFTLIIALDCGIKSVEKIDYARQKEIDFIICDHHRPGAEIPAASAVLDPKRADCNYPYDELSGCGIGFKLIQAYAQHKNMPFSSLISYLDLVVVSIASDIVMITGENRILAYYGLKLINSNPRPGIEAILNNSGLKRKGSRQGGNDELIFGKQLNINDLVFIIGPRINAAGRMESGRNSVELLISDDLIAAHEIAHQIDDFNTRRRDLDSRMTIEAVNRILADPKEQNKKSTVIYQPDWHKGVIGIVASRLTESFYRPTVVLTNSNGLICGSARSVKDFDVYDAIDACSDLLEHFGGHKYAAGLSLRPENLETFCKRFERFVCETIEDKMLVPEIEIDAEISLREINTRFFRVLNQFAPFGPGNMAPVFKTERVVDIGTARLVGKNVEKNHLKLSLTYPDVALPPFPAIAFQQGDMLNYILQGNLFDVCYHVEENEWNGNVTLQLNIKDIKPSSEKS